LADLDPLGINRADLDPSTAPELQLTTYALGMDLDVFGFPVSKLPSFESGACNRRVFGCCCRFLFRLFFEFEMLLT